MKQESIVLRGAVNMLKQFACLECVFDKFQRKQAKLQWLQDPSELNGDNLNIVIYKASSGIKRGNI
jgi:hypothetical protein